MDILNYWYAALGYISQNAVLKEQFIQKQKFNHYLFTSILIESSETFVELHSKQCCNILLNS